MLKKGLLIGLFTFLSFGITSGTPSSQTIAADSDPIWVPCLTCICRCHYYCDGEHGAGTYEYDICMDGCAYGCDND